MRTEFHDTMQRSDMAAELFFPVGSSRWRKGRFVVRKDERRLVRTQISGVRFQAADPRREDLAPERQCQRDVVNLVAGVRRLRELPDHQNLVLSRKTLRCRQTERGKGTRVKFGLYRDPRSRFEHDEEAAGTCHRRIVSAVGRSGFVVEHPKSYDPRTGLSGLQDWGSELRLRRKRRPWWLLLLPLLALLLLLGRDDESRFFGVPIETRSIVVLVDKSSSMAQHFAAVQREARAVLEEMVASGDTHYANVVAYDSGATAALDGITEVTKETSARLVEFLDRLRAGGGTNLSAGIERAARDVAAHDRPTTLLILTDGQDGSIGQMLRDLAPVMRKFCGVEIVGNTLTPRLFNAKSNPTPINEAERGLSDLAAALKGRFGGATP